MLELTLSEQEIWPVTLQEVGDLDPSLPCLSVAFVGSTMLLGERLPGHDPFAPLVAAVERWIGARIPVICSMEGGGLNGLTPLTFAGDRTVVDADLTGRAVPGLDQMSLLIDDVPNLVVACDTGAGGFALIETGRALDIERVVRSAIVQAGGVGGVVYAGFTVGDLAEHAINGGTIRALELGEAFLAGQFSPVAELAVALGGRLLGEGRITEVESEANDPYVHTLSINSPSGAIHRLITRSESLAFLTDGVLESSSPTIIVVIDAVSREVLEVTQLRLARYIAVIELPAPEWWTRSPERLTHVLPSAYGLDGLDGHSGLDGLEGLDRPNGSAGLSGFQESSKPGNDDMNGPS